MFSNAVYFDPAALLTSANANNGFTSSMLLGPLTYIAYSRLRSAAGSAYIKLLFSMCFLLYK